MKNRTYKYFTGTPLYPFGYGLTYGDCYVKPDFNFNVKYADANKATGAEITVTVANDGRFDTDEVVQLYIKDLDSEFATLNPSLCGFKRVHVPAGKEVTVTLSINERALTSVDEEGKRAIFAKNFRLYAGTQQPDARSEELTGHKCISVDFTI